MGQLMDDDGTDVVREKIAKYMAMVKNGEKVSHALKRLDQLDVTLELLSETGVGKVINKLRNHEHYGPKAMAIVEKWKAIAKSEGVSNGPEKPSSSSSTSTREDQHMKAYSKSNTYVEADERISKRTSDKMKESSLDPFAAQLAAADKLNASKPKKPKFSSSIVEEIERSLAMEGGNTSRASSATRSYSPLESEIDAKEGMFKRKGMSKVYSGKKVLKTIKGPVPSLFDTCMKVCMNNIDDIEETGDIPFDILRPVLEKCTYTQLARIESKNKYLEEDSDYLWERHCQKVFPNADVGDDEDETWKERFMRLTHERDQKLKSLSQRITSNVRDLAQPQRKAMLSDPIAPRYARQRQIRNGIMVSSAAVPSAAELSKSRRQIFETGNRSDLSSLPKALRNTNSTLGGSSSSSSSRNNNAKPQAKKGALMVKALKMMKGRR